MDLHKKEKTKTGIFDSMKNLLSKKDVQVEDQEKKQEVEKQNLKEYDKALKEERESKEGKKITNPESDSKDIEEKPEKDLGKKSSIQSITEKFRDSWKAPKILKTNLAKGEQTLYIDWDAHLRKIGVFVVIGIGAIVVVYIGLFIWELNAQNQAKILDSDIEYLQTLIQKDAEDIVQIDSFYENIKNANFLLEHHIYWTNIFTWLEKNTFKGVQLTTSPQGEPKLEYTFSVVAKDFTTLNQQVLHFKEQEEVLKVSTDGGAVITIEDKETGKINSQISATIELMFKDGIFNKQSLNQSE